MITKGIWKSVVFAGGLIIFGLLTITGYAPGWVYNSVSSVFNKLIENAPVRETTGEERERILQEYEEGKKNAKPWPGSETLKY